MNERSRIERPQVVIVSSAERTPGAVVVGGDYRALAVVRSLGRRGIPVCVVTDDHWLASASRYARSRVQLPDGGPLAELRFLEELGREGGVAGWMLIPTNDHSAELLSRHRRLLSKSFIVTVPDWESLRWAHDKHLSYLLADQVGVGHPWTIAPRSEADLVQARGHFPAIVKPSQKPMHNALTAEKAWRADDLDALREVYRAARGIMPAETLLVQELVAGDGRSQYSYAALARDGDVIASLTARRLRQWPPLIGRASTFVETIVAPDVADAAQRLIAAMRFTGLLEVEFKRDPKTGELLLLDINPRVWGWCGIGRTAGVDFPYLLWRMLRGEEVEPITAKAGVRWMRLVTDLPMALTEIVRGRLSIRDYLASFRPPVESAVFAPDDPLPGLAEIPLVLQLFVARHGL